MLRPVIFYLLTSLVLISLHAAAENSFYGSISSIPFELQKKMIGNTWHAGCPVPINDLSYLKLSYWGFDNKPHLGELIVNQRLAPEVLAIFKQLYESRFPIEKMVIPENLIKNKKFSNPIQLALYSDNLDNTSAFFCRIDGQNPKDFSPHAFGIAIDINPFYNPGVVASQYMPYEKGKKYLNRNIHHIGMIHVDDAAFNAFLNHGWQWGGFFTEGVDYMHFGKFITSHYIINHIEYVLPDQSIKNLNLH